MYSFNKIKYKQKIEETKFLPDVLVKICLDYITTTDEEKEQSCLSEIKIFTKNDYCYGDCQTNYDPPLPMCKNCATIENLMRILNAIRKGVGKSEMFIFNDRLVY